MIFLLLNMHARTHTDTTQFAILLDYYGEMPKGARPTLPKVPEIDQPLMETLKKMFQQRPCWSRLALKGRCASGFPPSTHTPPLSLFQTLM